MLAGHIRCSTDCLFASLSDGKINDFGTHEELMVRNEIYKEIYEQQTGAGSGDFDKQQEGGED